MESLAAKLKGVQPFRGASPWQTLFFGSIGEISPVRDLSPTYRIGLWPCISDSQPEVAMGLFTLLGYLLECWEDVRVYRVFARLEGEPETYQWEISESQFQVDDWEIDGLDENIAIWGDVLQRAGQWLLKIEIENDLAPINVENLVLEYSAHRLADFVQLLPSIANEIARGIALGDMRTNSQVYSINEVVDSDKAEAFLRLLFHWELRLLLSLWGKDWNREQVLKDEEALIVAGLGLEGGWGAWGVCSAVSRALQPIYELELLVPTLSQIIGRFRDIDFPALMFARPLYEIGYKQEAIDLLEANIAEHAGSVGSWLTLVDLYVQSREFFPAIDVLQRAIEVDIEDDAVFFAYARLLTVVDYEGWALDEFVLIDPTEKSLDQTIWEAVEAYQAILNGDPTNTEALYQQLVLFIDNGLRDTRLWSGLEQLVRLDKSGEQVRGVVDSLYSIDDISAAVDILRRAVKEEPNRVDLHVNLAIVYLVEEQGDAARSELKHARSLTDDPLMIVDIDRLMLAADDPEFEARLGELTDTLNAGNTVEVEDVEFLEEAVAKVPTFADAYLLLAKAYSGWDEPASALETLLDGQKHLPDDPDILEMLSRLLWESGQRKLAFEYLNKGLAKNPTHVPLLALSGLCHFEDGQEAEAKAFLARAELIQPRHPALNKVRLAIARRIGQAENDEEA